MKTQLLHQMANKVHQLFTSFRHRRREGKNFCFIKILLPQLKNNTIWHEI